MSLRWMVRLLVASLLAGCGDEGRASSDICTEYESTIDLGAPPVSFRNEVMPIFNRRCALSSCHSGGQPGGGLALAQGDASKSRASLVGVSAEQLPSMQRVAPGDPTKSYLMRKIDGDACIFSAQCRERGCGAPMPQAGELLAPTDRDKIRRWIGQGATAN